jgi:hypothetical protein
VIIQSMVLIPQEPSASIRSIGRWLDGQNFTALMNIWPHLRHGLPENGRSARLMPDNMRDTVVRIMKQLENGNDA